MTELAKPIVILPWVETPSASTTTATALKKRAIERWENEGGKIPPLLKPVGTPARDEA